MNQFLVGIFKGNLELKMLNQVIEEGATFPSWYHVSDLISQDLRKHYIFKIIPMLNPDGVIVGNYRCSLAGRDLNRNYRHPKKTSFPTVWGTKQMLADFSEECEVR